MKRPDRTLASKLSHRPAIAVTNFRGNVRVLQVAFVIVGIPCCCSVTLSLPGDLRRRPGRELKAAELTAAVRSFRLAFRATGKAADAALKRSKNDRTNRPPIIRQRQENYLVSTAGTPCRIAANPSSRTKRGTGMWMKLDQLAFRLFRQAYHAVLASPGDAKAHARFDKWAKLVGRIVGLPITGYHETHGPGTRTMGARGGGIDRRDDDALCRWCLAQSEQAREPAPPRGAIGQLTVVVSSTDTGVSSGYFWNTVTGQQFLGMSPIHASHHAGHMREAPMIALGSTVYLKPDGPD